MKFWQYLASVSGAIIAVVMALATISYHATLSWLPWPGAEMTAVRKADNRLECQQGNLNAEATSHRATVSRRATAATTTGPARRSARIAPQNSNK